jgi:hypothetical protein
MNATRNLLILTGVIVALGTMSKVRADFTFGEPVKFGPAMAASTDDFACFSSDGLELYINRGLGTPNCDLYVLTRASVHDDWGPAVNLGPAVNTPQDDAVASISADGLTLYFWSNRPGGYGDRDIYMTTRATRNAPWSPAVNMGATINSSAVDSDPWISADGLELYFHSDRPGQYGACDIYVARRVTEDDPWQAPVNLGPVVNSTYAEGCPCLSPDGLLLFLMMDDRPGGYGSIDFWMTRRASLSDPWQTPVNLGPTVNGPDWEFIPRLSADGRTLCFTGTRSGSWDVWQAPIIPTVDLNGDEIVDIKDLLRLIESWGKDDPAVDMGPMPWGDGKVDDKDLEVLMGYWQQEVLPVNLLAHWKLDEAEGTVAVDRASTNYGTLVGNPIWQPAGGKLGGALQLDGIDDYVRTPFVVDPAKGPFSVFAWVKGGVPGQVIVSQADGANWLMLDSAAGALMTDSQRSGRLAKALCSDLAITDGNWHRVGFTWDNSNRILYVDDAEVARDTQVSLAGSTGYMAIGTGSTLAAGTFWRGLIDDVRIYNQAVKP